MNVGGNSMKRLLYFILFLHLANPTFSQSDSATVKIIDDAIRSRNGDDVIIYVDSAFSYSGQLNPLVRKGGISGYYKEQKTRIALKRSELKLINSQFKIKNRFVWPSNMFANSFRISLDSIQNIFAESGSPVFSEKYQTRRFFLFTEPVFIRNKTIAVFRLAEMFGRSSGNDLFYFYKKSNGVWRHYMVCGLGAW